MYVMTPVTIIIVREINKIFSSPAVADWLYTPSFPRPQRMLSFMYALCQVRVASVPCLLVVDT